MIHVSVIAVLVGVVQITKVYLIIIVAILVFNSALICLSLYRQPVYIPKSAFMVFKSLYLKRLKPIITILV